jgi:hypothetical protein
MVWNVLKQFSSATFSKPTLLITWYLDKLSHWQTCRFLWLPKPPNESTKPGPDPWMVKGCLWKVPLQVPTIVSTWRDLCNTVANILQRGINAQYVKTQCSCFAKRCLGVLSESCQSDSAVGNSSCTADTWHSAYIPHQCRPIKTQRPLVQAFQMDRHAQVPLHNSRPDSFFRLTQSHT